MQALIAKDYAKQVEKQKQYPHKPLALAGDSLVAYFNPALFKAPYIQCFGVAGDTTKGLWQRRALIVATKPKAVVLQIGVNNLVFLDDDPQTIVTDVVALMTYFNKHHIDTYVSVPLPMNTIDFNNFYTKAFSSVDVEALRQAFRKQIKHEQQIDAYTNLASHGILKREYSVDGVHLTTAGYKVWLAAIKKVVKRND